MDEKSSQSLVDLLEGCDFTEKHLAMGEVLFDEGDSGEEFYLVSSGRLRAVRGLETDTPVVLGEIGRGEPVGEMAVLGETSRSASVVAMRDTELMEFCGTDIESLPKKTLLAVMRTLADRLKRFMQAGRRQMLPHCLTIVPINPDVPLTEYCSHLEDSLADAGKSSRLITSSDLPRELESELNQGISSPDAILKWVEDREIESDLVLLQTDSELTGWTQRCLHYGDVIVLVGKAGTDPSARDTEKLLERMQSGHACPSVFLVLIHDDPPYRNTADWLNCRNVARHFHVRLHSRTDRRRAARLLTGTDVSLALGGGGARGFAHIGILRAFEELDIPIDRIGGTSMGAIISALRAQGKTWEEIREIIRLQFIEHGSLKDLTLPLLSIDTGRRYINMLERMFGDLCIEDLAVNYFCISCNLTRAIPVVHRRGSVAKWIGASVSVPGIAPPLVEHGELLVDGGLLNNLPVDVIKDEGAGTVIGVDVSPATELSLPSDYSGRPQASEVIRSRLKWPRRDGQRGGGTEPGHGIPTLGNILYRATTLSSVYQKEALKKMADVYIKVPVDHFKMMGWEHLDELIEIGYRTGLEHLAPLSEAMGTGLGETQYYVSTKR